MLFNSLSFLLFFPIVAFLHFVVPHRIRWVLLLVASYYFYMSWEPIYALLIAFSTLTTFLASKLLVLERWKIYRKAILFWNLGVNLLILILFKYYHFLTDSIQAVLAAIGLPIIAVPDFQWLLPVGISFYTFQAIGYTLDVYYTRLKPEPHLGKYALFVSFFPQLVAGPIERSSNLLPQIDSKKFFSYRNAVLGARMMLYGYLLKLLLADNVAQYVDAVYGNLQHHNASSIALAVFFFSLQIYGDFAGYSLIAIGCAKVMGFDLMENFKRPYFARSIATFWGRWHISLSTWFRDYLYIPLGGNRVSEVKVIRNVLITFLVSGLWHGANWTFVVWGGIHGLMLILQRFLQKSTPFRRIYPLYSNIFTTYVLVTLAWIFFRSDNLPDALYVFQSLGSNTYGLPFFQADIFMVFFISLCLLLPIEIGQERFIGNVWYMLDKYPPALRFAYYTIGIISLLTFGVLESNRFIYFQF